MMNSFTVNENYGLKYQKLNSPGMSPHKGSNQTTTFMKLSSPIHKTNLQAHKHAQVLTEIRPL